MMSTTRLTNKETYELLEKAQKGDRNARNILIERNLKLVEHVAKNYVNEEELDDSIQEGVLGLSKAIEKFDVTKGYKFSTYAFPLIRQAITCGLYKSKTISIPINQLYLIRKIKLTYSKLMEELKRKPTPEELAKCVKISTKRLKFLLSLDQDTESLDMLKENPEFDIQDEEQDLDSVDLEKYKLDKIIEILRSVPDLNERDIKLFVLRIGSKKTLDYCAKTYGITKQRVDEIIKRVLKVIRTSPQILELANYTDNSDLALYNIRLMQYDNDDSEMILNDFIFNDNINFFRRKIIFLLRKTIKNDLYTLIFALRIGYIDGVKYSYSEISNIVGLSEMTLNKIQLSTIQILKSSRVMQKIAKIESLGNNTKKIK